MVASVWSVLVQFRKPQCQPVTGTAQPSMPSLRCSWRFSNLHHFVATTISKKWTKHISTGCRCSVVQGKPFAHLCTGYRSSFCSLEKMKIRAVNCYPFLRLKQWPLCWYWCDLQRKVPQGLGLWRFPTYPAAVQEKSTFAFTSSYIILHNFT